MFAAFVALGAGIFGLLVATAPTVAIAAVIGIPAALLSWNRPVYGVMLYTIMMASGIWYEWYQMIPLPGGYAVYPHELVFFLLFAKALSQSQQELSSHPVLRPVVRAGGVALGSVAFAALAALVRGQQIGTTVNGIRGYMLIALVPCVAILVKTDRERALLFRLFAAIIATVAVLMVAQLVLGAGVSVFPGARLDAGFEEASNLVRSHPPAVVLAAVMSSAMIALMLNLSESGRGPALLRWSLAIGGPVALLLSFWRSYWLAALIAAGCTLLLHAKRTSVRILLIGALFVVAIAAVGGPVLFPKGFTTGVVVIDVAAERLTNVFSGDVAQSGTILDRLYEFRVASEALARSPIFGVGPGMPYGAEGVRYRGGVAYLISRGSAHNSFLSIYLYLGIAGLIGFGYLFVSLLVAGMRVTQGRRGAESGALAAGLIGGTIVVLVATLVSNWLGNVSQLSAVGVGLGVMVSALRSRDA